MVVGVLRDNLCVVVVDYSFHIRHATVTYLNCIAVEDFMEGMVAREMLVDEG